LGLSACGTGEGGGHVRSERLYLKDCWNGAFDLGPDFFASTPMSEGSQIIRVQRGDQLQEVSDGLMVLVNDTPKVRSSLGEALPVSVARGVSPPGVPVVFDAEPALVNLALFLHDSCHTTNATLHSIDGEITFESLFSGDPNEANANDRLSKACFTARFADLRDTDEEHISTVNGCFDFFFQRGKPAQPFP
jgi:hypothetical protein